MVFRAELSKRQDSEHMSKNVYTKTREECEEKARRADKNDESRNRSRKEKGKTDIRKGATMAVALQYLGC